MNINEFPDIEKIINSSYKSKDFEGNQFESTLKKYTGPDKGIQWDDATGKLSVANGWHVNEIGEIVRD